MESPLLMYVLDFGLLVAFMYFGVQLLLALRWKRGLTSVPGARAAALFAILSAQTYSSVATESAAGILVWVAVGLVVPTTFSENGVASSHVPRPRLLSTTSTSPRERLLGGSLGHDQA